MRRSKNLKRFYIVLGCGWAAAALYFLLVTFPLIKQEKSLEEESAAAIERLVAAGHGMSTEEVLANIEKVRREIEAFSEVGRDEARTIRFSREVEEMLDRPFQLLDFDHRKFLFMDRIRALSREKNVSLFPDWESRFPVPGSEPAYLIWAQLSVVDQLFRTAIGAGVDRIEEVRLTASAREPGLQGPGLDDLEVSVQMRLTGKMEAIHSILMMLPLNGEELKELEMPNTVEPKSSFFLSRFILKKSSTENADEVSLDIVASGFLEAVSRH